MVDTDLGSYPVHLLQKWKQDAEAEATLRLTQRPLTQRAVQAQMATVLSAVPSKHSLAAVGNAHRATEEFLNGLDPRLTVTTSYVNGVSHLELRAKHEYVDVTMTFDESDKAAMREALEQMSKHGRPVSVEMSGMTVEGSPLLEYLNEGGPVKVELSSPVRPAQVQWHIAETADQCHTLVASFEGEAVAGSESLTATVSAFGGILKLQVTIPVGATGPRKASVSMGIDTAPWTGRDVRLLPDITPLCDILGKLDDGWHLSMEVYVSEYRILELTYAWAPGDSHIRPNAMRMRHARDARILAKKFDRRLPYADDYVLTRGECAAVSRAADMVSGTLIIPEDSAVDTVETIVDADFLQRHPDLVPGRSLALRMEVVPAHELTVFGQKFSMPAFHGYFMGQLVEVALLDEEAGHRAVFARAPGVQPTYLLETN